MKAGKGDALRQEQGHFASFLWPPGKKEWRLTGRDPPVLLGSKKNKEQQINDLLSPLQLQSLSQR
jgi:hypothetical protein